MASFSIDAILGTSQQKAEKSNLSGSRNVPLEPGREEEKKGKHARFSLLTIINLSWFSVVTIIKLS